MSLWHRAPREVYRVYGEDQYLEGETAPAEEMAQIGQPALADETAQAGQLASADETASPAGLYTGRLIGIGLLVGVGIATLALVFLNLGHSRGAPDLTREGARSQTGQQMAPAPDPTPRVRRVWSNALPALHKAPPTLHKALPAAPSIHPRSQLALRSPAPEPLRARAQGAVASSATVAADPSAQDEFGFEQ